MNYKPLCDICVSHIKKYIRKETESSKTMTMVLIPLVDSFKNEFYEREQVLTELDGCGGRLVPLC